MRTVTLEDAQRDLSRMLHEAGEGDGFIITEGETPLALVLDLRAVRDPSTYRFGFLPEASVPDDFDTMGQEELIAQFEGRE